MVTGAAFSGAEKLAFHIKAPAEQTHISYQGIALAMPKVLRNHAPL